MEITKVFETIEIMRFNEIKLSQIQRLKLLHCIFTAQMKEAEQPSRDSLEASDNLK